jgi:hypothetical protein
MTLKELLEDNANETIYDADASREILSPGYIGRIGWTIEELTLNQ